MKVIGFMQEKGGVGKTTLSTHVAAGLAIRGKRVLLMDVDGQGDSTTSLGIDPVPGFFEVIGRGQPWEAYLTTVPPELYEPPNTPSLGSLVILPGNQDTALVSGRTSYSDEIFIRLQEVYDAFDVVIVDTMPGPNLILTMVYGAADGIIYPTQLERLSVNNVISAIERHHHESRVLRNTAGDPVRVMGIIPTMMRGTAVHQLYYDNLRDTYGDLVWGGVSLRTVLQEANAMQQTIFAYAPDHSTTDEMWRIVDRMMTEINQYEEGQ